MCFTIRIRFRIPAHKLKIEETEIVVGVSANGQEIRLKSADLKSSISNADWLVLISAGWATKEVAETESINLMDSLCRSLSFHNLSADFGRRMPGGAFFNSFLNELTEQHGRTILNDERGIMIYETKLNPLVARVGELSLVKNVSKEAWTSSFQDAVNHGETFTDREQMAFDLFTMAHKAQESADARFVLLFAALETLLVPTERSQAAQNHVDNLINETLRNVNLTKTEKQSLTGSLGWLKRHTIRNTGKEFIRLRLGDRKYGEIASEQLFLDCYDIRNRLLHGNEPYATWREISNIVAQLELMVSHLLSGKLYSFQNT